MFIRITRNGDPLTLTGSAIKKELEDIFGFERNSLKKEPFKGILNVMINDYVSNLENQEDLEKGNQQDNAEITSNTSDNKGDTEQLDQPNTHQDSKEEEEKPAISTKRKRKTTIKQPQSDTEEEEKEVSDHHESHPTTSDEDDSKASEPTTPPISSSTKKQRPSKGQPEKKGSTRNIKSTKTTSPDDETIKRLKSYIYKCGVRKVWQKELADCPTKKSQINKLKKILQDLGMDGRPTLEKCEAIKAERELRAEIDSLNTENILDDSTNGPSLRSTRSNRTKKRRIIEDEDDDDSSTDKPESTPLDVSFLGDQSDDDSD
ncbi:uncharacterized protein BX664DRAFT_334019 [Halteromyces radiatus]|uniref:uncharacterized protein n=1 Tax=Halteromyces radiatus TaxID=101107 RepID=UPI0022206624|nr:uncharacterized protein BX664DRAFT_334019 [Halteromyces radiatus]KAI8089833.1 hypothetical protein BX664DRAFT_334019 [Halteromyces radiatus]